MWGPGSPGLSAIYIITERVFRTEFSSGLGADSWLAKTERRLNLRAHSGVDLMAALGRELAACKTLALLSRLETREFGPTQHRHHLSANGAARARAFVSVVIAFGQLAAGEP